MRLHVAEDGQAAAMPNAVQRAVGPRRPRAAGSGAFFEVEVRTTAEGGPAGDDRLAEALESGQVAGRAQVNIMMKDLIPVRSALRTRPAAGTGAAGVYGVRSGLLRSLHLFSAFQVAGRRPAPAGGGRRVCHGAPATSAPVDHASRASGGRTVRPPRRDIREQRRELNGRVDTLAKELNDRIESFAADVSKRFDDVKRELAELRERMAKLEGSLEGFLTGRRDRDVA